MRLACLLGLAGLLGACSYRPPHFGAAPAVQLVADGAPGPVPERHAQVEELREASVYVRRELVKVFDPRRPNTASDVNALDEVPASSWMHAVREFDRPLRGYRRDGPPVPPLVALSEKAASETPGARAVVDARGLRYELVPEDPERAAMRTGAAAAASRLLFGLGYRTAEVHVVLEGGVRFAAQRWPVGVDLGPTTPEGTRDDDPNDGVDHRDRRSLRGLKVAAAWLDLEQLPPRVLRDHYVGAPGRGHVEHTLVGVDGALGVDRYHAALKWTADPDRADSNFFHRLFSFGLAPKPAAYAPAVVGQAVGLFEEYVDVGDFSASPPFEPFDRMLPGDAYWIAKRIASLPVRALGRAVISARLPPLDQHALLRLLDSRRAQVVGWGFDRVTPLEPGAVVTEPGGGLRVGLVDLAIHSGMTPAATTRYHTRFLDEEGGVLAESRAPARGTGFELVVPPEVAARGYIVASVLGLRQGRALPRPVEVHLRPRAGRFAVVGLRH